jgi:hypothetical protein
MAKLKKPLSLKPRAPKQAAPRITRATIDAKYVGTEPVWTLDTPTNIQMIQAFNWYAYQYVDGFNKKALSTYLKNTGKDPSLISDVVESEIPGVVGAMCAMIGRGFRPDEAMMERFEKRLQDIYAIALVRQSEKIALSATPKPVKKSSDTTIAELEEFKDQALLGTLDADWSAYSWATSRKTSAVQANKVIAYYTPILDELKAATKRGADPELKEGYRSLSMMEKRRSEAFMSGLIADMEKIKGAKNVARKPRKPRAKTLWLFDTKYRKLIRAEGENLTVKGTTVEGITNTTSKTIRKPEDVISEFAKLTRLQKGKTYSAIKSTEGKWSCRTNENMLIIAVEV